MKISINDFKTMLQELMRRVNYTQKMIDDHFNRLQEGNLDLPTLCCNVAIHCFVNENNTAHAKVLRQYLQELNNTGTVHFPEEIGELED